jgi:hypothetical protein
MAGVSRSAVSRTFTDGASVSEPTRRKVLDAASKIQAKSVCPVAQDAALQPYIDMLKKQQASGKFTDPAIRQMSATAVTAELHRIYDGKLQGLHLLVNPGAPGSRSPWVTR